jgi:hypothetical protein
VYVGVAVDEPLLTAHRKYQPFALVGIFETDSVLDVTLEYLGAAVVEELFDKLDHDPLLLVLYIH